MRWKSNLIVKSSACPLWGSAHGLRGRGSQQRTLGRGGSAYSWEVSSPLWESALARGNPRSGVIGQNYRPFILSQPQVLTVLLKWEIFHFKGPNHSASFLLYTRALALIKTESYLR